MRSFIASVLFVAAAASQVLALNVTFPKAPSMVDMKTLLDFPTGAVRDPCTANCTLATTTFNACTDDICVCSNATAQAIQSCEQCLLNDLIKRNVPPPSDIVGSNPVMTAYVGACALTDDGINHGPTQEDKKNITIPAQFAALSLAPDWNGPVSLGLGLVGGIFAVTGGVMLAGGSLLIMCNL